MTGAYVARFAPDQKFSSSHTLELFVAAPKAKRRPSGEGIAQEKDSFPLQATPSPCRRDQCSRAAESPPRETPVSLGTRGTYL